MRKVMQPRGPVTIGSMLVECRIQNIGRLPADLEEPEVKGLLAKISPGTRGGRGQIEFEVASDG